MNANVFTRLRALFPTSQTLIARVVAHNADDTSTLELPTNQALQTYATGVSTGSTFTARGRPVAVGLNAFVRDGVAQSQAPSAAPADVVIGTVVALPFGPARLAAAAAQTLVAGKVGVTYAASLAAATPGGYAPFTRALASGTLPPGLTLSAAGLTGTPTVAGIHNFTLTVVDSTRRSVTTAAIGVTITT